MEVRARLRVFILLIVFLVYLSSTAKSDTDPGDVAVIQILSKNLNAESSLGWTGLDPCKWTGIRCLNNRITSIQLGKSNLKGTLPQDIKNLTNLVRLELQSNNLTGDLPSLKGMNSLQVVIVSNNDFTSIPSDFFSGLSSLQTIALDGNQFSAWEIPESLKDATSLASFSAMGTNITGNLPDFFDSFPSLNTLLLSFNSLEGGLPMSLSQTQIQTLWINGQKGMKFTGSIDVLKNMTSLVQIWLNGNGLTGPIPDLSGLNSLQDLNFRDNALTGIVPPSLISLPKLKTIKLTNNKLQGPTPKFPDSVSVDMIPSTNSFCLTTPGQPCDPRVTTLLLFAQSVNFPTFFADNWKGNDPCTGWPGITCDSNANITIINLQKRGLSGVISPSFQYIKSLQRLLLSNNNLTGTIPPELTSLPALREIDLSNNLLSGKVPNFAPSVLVNTNGNRYIGLSMPSPSPFVGVTPGPQSDTPRTSDVPKADDQNQVNHESDKKSSATSRVVGSIVGGIVLVLIVGLLSFCIYKKKQKSDARVQSPNTTTIHAQNSCSDQDAVKITVAGSSMTGGTTSETHSRTSSAMNNEVQVVEAGNMVISIQVLRDVTNNFCDNNVIGQGGFGTVYKGELHDGTQIAVKRMMSGVIGEKGLNEFKSEISVLSKVRHRNLVAFLGYCLDVNERLLVLEYVPQGTLSRHLFEWKKEGLKPLDWTRRLSIALDVARGVEYLHNLAHQSFIHRDLKPSNILLGDNMRAKVADFGLVRLAPEGKCSVETRLAGTFGYLAPEYAVTGRVTTKADVFSFGVILMELITGRKALDESQPEESMHLVTWFRRLHLNKGSFPKVIDPSIDLSDETTISSINTVAELAGHCCAREPYQRPVMGHAVNVLSSLVEMWKPSEPDLDDIFGIDLDMPLSQALKKWQASEDSSQFDSSFIASSDNTQTSIPTRPSGFADSFTSSDGR